MMSLLGSGDRVRRAPRRRAALGAGVLLAGGGLLSACGGSSSSNSATTASTSPTTVATTTTTSDSSGNSGSSGTSASGAVHLSDGVTVVPASGWIPAQAVKATTVDLVNPAHTAFYFVSVGPSNLGGATAQLEADIKQDSDPANGNQDYSDVQVQGTPSEDTPSDASTFDQSASVPFTATGEVLGAVSGLYGELYSTTTHLSVFVILYAEGASALQSAEGDAGQMNRSIESSSS